jgi:hypothetical protein
MKTLIASFAVLFVCPMVQAATVSEIESNDLHTTPQFISPFDFTSDYVVNIQSSTSYKHATIAATGNGTVDWFVFSHAGGRIILDIDEGMPNIDLELGIWDSSGNLVAQNDDGGILDSGSVHVYDSFIDLASEAAGLYYVAVSAFPSTQASNFTIGGGGFTTSGYKLHISSGAVPEPSSTLLLGLTSAFLLVRRRR